MFGIGKKKEEVKNEDTPIAEQKIGEEMQEPSYEQLQLENQKLYGLLEQTKKERYVIIHGMVKDKNTAKRFIAYVDKLAELLNVDLVERSDMNIEVYEKGVLGVGEEDTEKQKIESMWRDLERERKVPDTSY